MLHKIIIVGEKAKVDEFFASLPKNSSSKIEDHLSTLGYRGKTITIENSTFQFSHLSLLKTSTGDFKYLNSIKSQMHGTKLCIFCSNDGDNKDIISILRIANDYRVPFTRFIPEINIVDELKDRFMFSTTDQPIIPTCEISYEFVHGKPSTFSMIISQMSLFKARLQIAAASTPQVPKPDEQINNLDL